MHSANTSAADYALTERDNRWTLPDGSILRLRGGLVLLVFGVGILVRDAIVQARKRH